MDKFSERMGLTSPRSVIQTDDIDDALKNKLWDLTSLMIKFKKTGDRVSQYPVLVEIWLRHFHASMDTLMSYGRFFDARSRLKELFYEEMFWYEVYDLIEFILRLEGMDPRYAEALNRTLSDYMAGYRWVGNKIVPLTDEQQIGAIEDALNHESSGVRSHLSKALSHLADRGDPDLANSIKESISAVESVCQRILGKNPTLGAALKKLEDAGVTLHPAQVAGWEKMYGFTSDKGGIRHAMQDDPGLTVDDAMYFLVSCSAFVSLLTAKAQNAGITFDSAT